MKKRVLAAALCMVIALALLPVSAFADVIVEPNDDFFNSNRSECSRLDRLFSAAGPDGRVVFYKSPKNSASVFTLDNDDCIWIRYVYTGDDGISWGVGELYENGRYKSGWAPMDYLWEEYSSDMFISQYSGLIHSGDRIADIGAGDGTVYFWKYPGSDTYVEYNSDISDLSFSRIFTDELGRDWGYEGYYYGIRDSWVLLDNPGATYEEIFPDGAPLYDTREKTGPAFPGQNGADNPSSAGVEIKPDGGGSHALLICGIAVAGVVTVTAVLLVLLKKKQ